MFGNAGLKPRRSKLIIGLALIILTLGVFWQVQNYDFIGYDDTAYILENPRIQSGFNKKSVIWAFTTFYPDYWHPLPWLSHILEYQLYGINPRGYHLNNLLFHLANVLLLFTILNQMTGTLLRSAFVAALFALHPLHVESVVWAIERKDMLSTLFWMLTIRAYVRFVERPGWMRYTLTLLFFILGLMSKPMLVTLPFVLLLMDYWPLDRARLEGVQNSSDRLNVSGYVNPNHCILKTSRLIREKIPFFFFAGVSCFITIFSSRQMGTMVSLENLTIPIRISNALISYVSYIGKLLWPHHLTLIYPHPGNTVSILHSSASGLLMIFITLFVIKEMRWRPYLAVGWIWYVLTLSPVIGIFQAGSQAMADRFTYIPLIGLFICIAWGLPDLMRKLPYSKILLTISAGLAVALCMVSTFIQLQHWKNGITLFEHAIRVTTNNYRAHYCLASELSRKGNLQNAIFHYRKALSIKPDYADARNGMGVALARLGKLKEAVSHQLKALEKKPKNENYHNDLGVSFARQGKINRAMLHYSQALRIRPDFLTARLNLGFILHKQGRHQEAITHYQEALRIKADIPEANYYLGIAYYSNGNRAAALKRHEILRSIDSDLADRLLNRISR